MNIYDIKGSGNKYKFKVECGVSVQVKTILESFETVINKKVKEWNLDYIRSDNNIQHWWFEVETW